MRSLKRLLARLLQGDIALASGGTNLCQVAGCSRHGRPSWIVKFGFAALRSCGIRHCVTCTERIAWPASYLAAVSYSPADNPGFTLDQPSLRNAPAWFLAKTPRLRLHLVQRETHFRHNRIKQKKKAGMMPRNGMMCGGNLTDTKGYSTMMGVQPKRGTKRGRRDECAKKGAAHAPLSSEGQAHPRLARGSKGEGKRRR